MKADSGNSITRGWCDECGCGLWIKPPSKPEMTCLKAGELLSRSLSLGKHLREVDLMLAVGQNMLIVGLTLRAIGLFQPHTIPNPTMENWLKNKEPWETPVKGTKRQSDVQ